MSTNNPKIALVFDWMTTYGGAEKVNLQLHRMFPEAPIFTSIYNPKKIKGFEKAKIYTSFINKLPLAKNRHQIYLSLMPQAYENFDLSNFDIVISSSHSCAKGIITKPETLHISYCHAPMRYAWGEWTKYITDYKMNPLLKYFGKKQIHKIRIWDRLSAERVDSFISNSTTTQRRINKYYKKQSTVIFPSINANEYEINEDIGDYYLAVGRLIPYKKFDLLIESFKKNKLPLKIVGTGISENDLREQAAGHKNIEFLGHTSNSQLIKLYSQAKALIFPQLEDFGITPLESMASGRPVIAYGAGGALDTIIDGETGYYFKQQTPGALNETIQLFEKDIENFSATKIRQHSLKFHHDQFEKKFRDHLHTEWEKWNANR
ncbi:glycosyltransferase family 4 protein [Candidatus Peregrinibacteria bacterium HGW-Peregrinibacteria-1]|jgi:glycosyltransferase involved in cell wall biosynthesis|nr:MAG: glycosyltransferase family 4 protein [Candidatus Peregrinibacteria bacterium HGW-Peregrinibacteria-1]